MSQNMQSGPRGGAERHGPRRRTRRGLAALVALAALLAPLPAAADRYDRDHAGHPLRILAYVVHPIGVVIDFLILRPAHWIASQEPIQTLVGHEDSDD